MWDNYIIVDNVWYIGREDVPWANTGDTLKIKYTQTESNPTIGKIESFNVTQNKQWSVYTAWGVPFAAPITSEATNIATNIVFYTSYGGILSDIKFVDVDKK